jgi:hypothetical protein
MVRSSGAHHRYLDQYINESILPNISGEIYNRNTGLTFREEAAKRSKNFFETLIDKTPSNKTGSLIRSIREMPGSDPRWAFFFAELQDADAFSLKLCQALKAQAWDFPGTLETLIEEYEKETTSDEIRTAEINAWAVTYKPQSDTDPLVIHFDDFGRLIPRPRTQDLNALKGTEDPRARATALLRLTFLYQPDVEFRFEPPAVTRTRIEAGIHHEIERRMMQDRRRLAGFSIRR